MTIPSLIWGAPRWWGVALALLGVGGLLAASGCAVMTPFLVDGLIAQGQPPGRAAALLAVAGWLAIGARGWIRASPKDTSNHRGVTSRQ